MKRRKFKQGQILLIDWLDATGDSSWTTRGEVTWPEMRCQTVGFFWDSNPDAIMLMDSLFRDFQKKDGTIGGMKTVPWGMVLNILPLDPPE